jgi:hypothetical protein
MCKIIQRGTTRVKRHELNRPCLSRGNGKALLEWRTPPLGDPESSKATAGEPVNMYETSLLSSCLLSGAFSVTALPASPCLPARDRYICQAGGRRNTVEFAAIPRNVRARRDWIGRQSVSPDSDRTSCGGPVARPSAEAHAMQLSSTPSRK